MRFAVNGNPVNAAMMTSYEKNQQYGCNCDIGYRGADCSQGEREGRARARARRAQLPAPSLPPPPPPTVECPSGPDVMGADGGAQGMDCSGRGLCDYTVGTCACFRGFFGSRCEQQSTLV